MLIIHSDIDSIKKQDETTLMLVLQLDSQAHG
jgi:hypothetical protein